MMTGKRRFEMVAVVGALAAAVTACAPVTDSDAVTADLERTPRPMETAAPVYDDAGLSLPPGFEDARILDPGWDVPPQESGGIYLALRAEADRVVFTAVSAEGTVLWTADRPVLCSAFVVTADEDGPVAVLMDITAGDTTVSETTVSAYDLRTGAQRWGPVDVPGPHVGPGLVFAAPPPDAMGSNGPRVVIDAATGHRLADESEEEGMTILGERDGIALLTDETRLIARTADTRELWALPADALDQPTDVGLSTATFTADEDVALIGESSAGATLVQLATGAVIAYDVHGTALDRSTGNRIILDDELRAVDVTGHTVWSREIPADALLLTAGDGVVYVRTADGIDVFSTVSGEVLRSLPSDADVPQLIVETGAGIVGSYQRPLLFARGR